MDISLYKPIRGTNISSTLHNKIIIKSAIPAKVEDDIAKIVALEGNFASNYIMLDKEEKVKVVTAVSSLYTNNIKTYTSPSFSVHLLPKDIFSHLYSRDKYVSVEKPANFLNFMGYHIGGCKDQIELLFFKANDNILCRKYKIIYWTNLNEPALTTEIDMNNEEYFGFHEAFAILRHLAKTLEYEKLNMPDFTINIYANENPNTFQVFLKSVVTKGTKRETSFPMWETDYSYIMEMDFKIYEKEDLKNFSMRPMIIKIEDKDGNEIKR